MTVLLLPQLERENSENHFQGNNTSIGRQESSNELRKSPNFSFVFPKLYRARIFASNSPYNAGRSVSLSDRWTHFSYPRAANLTYISVRVNNPNRLSPAVVQPPVDNSPR
ncbi:hypothetical protein NPIL_70291 [Nephila pilipes]|uniref:Uncharacterized protein n=1 Tax=Nephila pilipes TaxID=299642 RepID=A0A8X6T5E5_NEPPI|nr:hypothetical protein NPIL_70291 [Nephila pilipes]